MDLECRELFGIWAEREREKCENVKECSRLNWPSFERVGSDDRVLNCQHYGTLGGLVIWMNFHSNKEKRQEVLIKESGGRQLCNQ